METAPSSGVGREAVSRVSSGAGNSSSSSQPLKSVAPPPGLDPRGVINLDLMRGSARLAEVIRRGAVSSEVLNPPPPPLPTAYGSGVSNTPTIQREGRPSRAKGSGKASVVNYGPHQRVWRVLDSPPGRLSLAGASRQTPTGPIPTPTPRHSHFGEQPRPRRRAARPWPRHGRRRSAARRPSAT